jgi:hypothetical protein
LCTRLNKYVLTRLRIRMWHKCLSVRLCITSPFTSNTDRRNRSYKHHMSKTTGNDCASIE